MDARDGANVTPDRVLEVHAVLVACLRTGVDLLRDFGLACHHRSGRCCPSGMRKWEQAAPCSCCCCSMGSRPPSAARLYIGQTCGSSWLVRPPPPSMFAAALPHNTLLTSAFRVLSVATWLAFDRTRLIHPPTLARPCTDDLDADWKQDHTAIMPHLTKYWKEGGIYFENHVAAVPVCGPSRSSLLTGRYPHNNGYLMNSDSPSINTWCGANNPKSNMNHTVGGWVARAGYHTAFLGKTVNSCESWANNGWSHWGGLINTYDFYNASIHDVDFSEDGVTPTRVGAPKVMTGIHQAQFLADFTVDQATLARKGRKPFYISTTPVMPHWGTCEGGPGAGPGVYAPDDPHWEYGFLTDPANPNNHKVALPISPCPSHKHAHDFDGQTNPHIPSWNVSASGVVPKAMQVYAAQEVLDAYSSEREDIGWRNRSAAVVDLDDLIGAVFAGFESLGVLDDTYAIFTSDNGYHLGEHKLVFGKGHPYEPSVRLPMYIRGPGVPKGVVSKLPTTHLDITATIIELVGAAGLPTTPKDLDGKSFAAALTDTTTAANLRRTPELWRAFSFSEFFAGETTWWNVRTVNSTHKFSLHYWCTGETEVFDLLTDPLQLHNLAGTPSQLGVAAVGEVLPMALALSSCAHTSCVAPEPKALPPLAPNQTHLECYTVSKAPQHPEWPEGSVSTVGVNHYFSGWSCVPDPAKANQVCSPKLTVAFSQSSYI